MAKKKMKKKDIIGNLDVVFIIDSTGSMGPYIKEAQDRAVSIIKKLQEDNDLDIRVALVAYRDHPPQDDTFVTKVFDFDIIDNFQTSLNTLEAYGGGDTPEAVWPGVHAMFGLTWRDKSDRVAYLIGDSPPHGYAGGGADGFPQGDPSGITVEQLISSLKEFNVQLNAHSIANINSTTEAFKLLSVPTEGVLSVGDRAQDTTIMYSDSLREHAGTISTSRAIINTMNSTGVSYYCAATSLGLSEEQITKTSTYLIKRGIINE